jgi:hypothetical protein
MHLNKNVMIVVVSEQAFLEWSWQLEIAKAIYDVKRRLR